MRFGEVLESFVSVMFAAITYSNLAVLWFVLTIGEEVIIVFVPVITDNFAILTQRVVLAKCQSRKTK